MKISKHNINNSKYTIKSVIDENNQIIITFNTNVTKDYVKFYEKFKNTTQDIYELKGNFKDAFPTKLKIDGVKEIVIKQEDKNTLKILLKIQEI